MNSFPACRLVRALVSICSKQCFLFGKTWATKGPQFWAAVQQAQLGLPSLWKKFKKLSGKKLQVES